MQRRRSRQLIVYAFLILPNAKHLPSFYAGLATPGHRLCCGKRKASVLDAPSAEALNQK